MNNESENWGKEWSLLDSMDAWHIAQRPWTLTFDGERYTIRHENGSFLDFDMSKLTDAGDMLGLTVMLNAARGRVRRIWDAHIDDGSPA